MSDYSLELEAARSERRMEMVWIKRIMRVVSEELGIGLIPMRLKFVHLLMTLLPYHAARRIRTLLYRSIGFKIGARTLLYDKLILTGAGDIYKNLQIGESCRINTPCRIGLTGQVTLGNYVVLGHGVNIITETHNTSSVHCRAGGLAGHPVVIEDGVWIAANVIILPGVTIGTGAIVGAGSVVTRDVDPHTLVAGNPARFIRTLLPQNLREMNFIFSGGSDNSPQSGSISTFLDIK